MSFFSELTPTELAERLTAWGFKSSHAATLLRTFYHSGGMSLTPSRPLLPSSLLARLEKELPAHSSRVLTRQVSADGTVKLLRQLHDQRTVECVLMPDFREDRAAGCLSSQVGCAMGCDFCATTQTGFERNLSSGEIVEQFLSLRAEALASGRRLQTVVFMGMGEPMLNLPAVLAAVKRIAGNELGGLGWRQITISTVGIIPGIRTLAESGLPVHLALSLHAPDDTTRAEILPTARRFPVQEILAAADDYQGKTGRPVIIQYCLLQGVNDSPEQAHLLAELVGQRRMHVNLLAYNATGLSLKGRHYQAPNAATTTRFLDILRQCGVVAHLRRARGPEIDAACGQLRKRALDANPTHKQSCGRNPLSASLASLPSNSLSS